MKKCTYKDLTVVGTSNTTCLVTEDFEVGETIEDTGLENIESVDCDNCNEFFADLAGAKEHIAALSQKETKDNE